MYQQSPKQAGGSIFKDECMQYGLPEDLPASFDTVIPDGFLLADSATKVKPGNRIAYQWNGYSGLGKMTRKVRLIKFSF